VSLKIPFISIIIPLLNEERYLAACLDSLNKLDYPRDKFEIIIVDNGSTDASLDIAGQYEVQIYQHPRVKVGAVRNYGVTKAKGELVVFIDSDCVAEPDWLHRGVASLGERYKAVGGLYLLREHPAWIERYWILKSTRDFTYQTTFVGGCIFIWRDIFNSLGGFDEAMSAGEDTDITQRLKSSGHEINIDPQLSVVHLGYPVTIGSFIKRQMWHSENYYQNFRAALGDKVFLLTNAFMLGFILVLSSPLLGSFSLLTGVLLFATSPLALSAKRILRYKAGDIGVSGMVSVYLVDMLYLVGRVFGALRSLRKAIASGPDQKSTRR